MKLARRSITFFALLCLHRGAEAVRAKNDLDLDESMEDFCNYPWATIPGVGSGRGQGEPCSEEECPKRTPCEDTDFYGVFSGKVCKAHCKDDDSGESEDWTCIGGDKWELVPGSQILDCAKPAPRMAGFCNHPWATIPGVGSGHGQGEPCTEADCPKRTPCEDTDFYGVMAGSTCTAHCKDSSSGESEEWKCVGDDTWELAPGSKSIDCAKPAPSLLARMTGFCNHPWATIPGVGSGHGQGEPCTETECPKRTPCEDTDFYGVMAGSTCTAHCKDSSSGASEEWKCVGDDKWELVPGSKTIDCSKPAPRMTARMTGFCNHPWATIPGVGSGHGQGEPCSEAECPKRTPCEDTDFYGVMAGSTCVAHCKGSSGGESEEWKCVGDDKWELIPGSGPITCGK